MKTTRMAFIVLILALCVGCDGRGGGCSCHRLTYYPPPLVLKNEPSSNNQLSTGNAWQNSDNLGSNQTPSGISSRNMTDQAPSRDDRRY